MGQDKQNISSLIGAYPTCGECGSRQVVRDAWTKWNFGCGDWVLKAVFDHFVCDGCGAEIAPEWKLDEGFRKKRICRLNDALRRGEGENATVVITAGVQVIGREFMYEVNHAVATFDSFSGDNDPYGEHDFGAVDVQGKSCSGKWIILINP